MNKPVFGRSYFYFTFEGDLYGPYPTGVSARLAAQDSFGYCEDTKLDFNFYNKNLEDVDIDETCSNEKR